MRQIITMTKNALGVVAKVLYDGGAHRPKLAPEEKKLRQGIHL